MFVTIFDVPRLDTMHRLFSLLVLTCVSVCSVTSQTPGVSIYYEQYVGDTREYIEYIPGNLPIIISAPHGGVKQSGSTVGGVFYPDNDATLPDRNCGVNERDDNTDILAREIQAEIHALTGCYAHVIISNLHRSKLDPNREIGVAACGDSDAEDHWTAFHDFIDDASTSVEAVWGKGLFIDLHGQSHSIPRIELGYNVTAAELNTGDLNSQSIINKSTIKHLVTANLHGHTHEQLIRGDSSLGEFLHTAAGTFYAAQGYPGCSHNNTNGYRAIPSHTNTGGTTCDDTRPHNHSYFDGDFYNNRRHGSGTGAHDGSGMLIGGGGSVDGIMSEVNRRVRDLGVYNGAFYDSRPQTLVPFAKDYAQVLLDYVGVHYNDYAKFTYGDCVISLMGSDPLPTIQGQPGGTFSANSSSLQVDPSTGQIDLGTTTAGTYTVYYSLGDCDYYQDSTFITIAGRAVGYVDIAASGTASGTSWADAHTSLEAALSSPCQYDTIKVAEGTYIPATNDRQYTYAWYSDLTIQGGYASQGLAFDPELYTVTLSGNIGTTQAIDDNLYHIVYVEDNVTNLALHHLTVADGYADGSGTEGVGSAIYNAGQLSLHNVLLSDNTSAGAGQTVFNTGTLEVSNSTTIQGSSGF